MTEESENPNSSGIIPSDFEWLRDEAPGFSLCGDQIKILFTPEEFYAAVINGCSKAKQRITMAALYIGTTSQEQRLVEVLDNRMSECGKSLRVSILLDAVRGSRDNSAQSMLLPLIRKHPHCQVSLYHTPDLRGLWLRFLPAKVNELVGVQHIKLYVFDDDIIISGANLTKEYFSNRQDRYMFISVCQPIADFCDGLTERISSVSLRLMENGGLTARLPHLHPYLNPPGTYEKHAQDIVLGFYKQALRQSDKFLKPGDDTWIFPLLQLPPLGIYQDSIVTQNILESFHPKTIIDMSSPYFNLTEEYIFTIVRKCRATFNVLIPHPTANDFYGARGFAGQIPWLYSALSCKFLKGLENTDQQKRFSIEEFVLPGKSFHSKGIWSTVPGEDCPYMTIVGSSNYNYRSVKRDLECQMVVFTGNSNLRFKLQEEKRRLYKYGVPFTQDVAMLPDRKPKLWQIVWLWLFKSYL